MERPGYLGSRRNELYKQWNRNFGVGGWRLSWVVNGKDYEFLAACREFYEEAYYQRMSVSKRLDYICSFGECIDNAMSNIQSGCDYTKQESGSTHIQDIAVRNVLLRLGRKFEGAKSKILEIRSTDSNGYMLSPGRVMFHKPELILKPSKRPKWAQEGSVEDFWQSNKFLQSR